MLLKFLKEHYKITLILFFSIMIVFFWFVKKSTIEILHSTNKQIDNNEQDSIVTSIPVSITDASPTYSNYGFENALNPEPSKSYVAGFEGQKIAFVDLALKQPEHISELFIQWENNNNFAKKIRVIKIDKNENKELLEYDNDKGTPSYIALPNVQKLERIRIEFSDFAGQPRLLLRQIQLYLPYENKDRKQVSGVSLDQIYLNETDRSNPLYLFRQPITIRIKNLSDQLSKDATSEHQKIINFMNYISSYKVGRPSDSSLETLIDERVGICGNFTNLLLALAAAQQMQGRIINLHNFPKNDGHSVAEIYFHEKWHLYDPTFAAFYKFIEKPDELPLSFAEILEGYKTKPDTIKIEVNSNRRGGDSYMGRDIFLKANPAGPIGPDRIMIFPLGLELGKQDKLERVAFGPSFQGGDFIGAAYTNQQQSWKLKGLTPEKKYEFVIYPHRLGGDINMNNMKFCLSIALKGGQLKGKSEFNIDFAEEKISPLIIEFKAQQPEVTLNISHPYRGPDYRYVEVGSYQLREAKACMDELKNAA
jgi:hypothetical protein